MDPIDNALVVERETYVIDAKPTPTAGKRIVAGGRVAPQLLVRYRCPQCGTQAVLDAYAGVPSCKGPVSKRHAPEFLVALELV